MNEKDSEGAFNNLLKDIEDLTEERAQIAKVILANSITLTPGTITVSEEKGVFCVHALDKSLADGIESCSFVEILKKMEASWK